MAESNGIAERILECIEQIPPGKVMTYGDVAEFVGTRSARTVGRVLAQDGGTVPWHRVLRSDGSLAEHLYTEQRQRLLSEGVLPVVIEPIGVALGIDRPAERMPLVASQVIGLILMRYVLVVEPLASMPRDRVIATYAPTIQRYLTGDLP